MRNWKLLAAVLAVGVWSLAGDGSARHSQPKPAEDSRQFSKALSKEKQIIHALDRLTFGARPGDDIELRKMGLKKWINRQLHPEIIAETPVLDAKLKPLESLRMTQAEIVRNYPTPQIVARRRRGA